LRRIAAEVSRTADVPLARARLIVRTEVLRAYRSAQLDVYAGHPDVPEWMWVAAKDSRCCAACWAMHGTKHRAGTPMKAHPGCRCTAVPVVRGDNLDLGDGAADFAAAGDDVQRRVLGPAAKRAYDAGVLDLRSLVGVRTSPVWGESVAVRSLRQVLGPDGARRFYRR
jgi:SPP1 gp7 family putative phage head morphogenesis protein